MSYILRCSFSTQFEECSQFCHYFQSSFLRVYIKTFPITAANERKILEKPKKFPLSLFITHAEQAASYFQTGEAALISKLTASSALDGKDDATDHKVLPAFLCLNAKIVLLSLTVSTACVVATLRRRCCCVFQIRNPNGWLPWPVNITEAIRTEQSEAF